MWDCGHYSEVKNRHSLHQALGLSCFVCLSVCLGAYGYFKENFLRFPHLGWDGYHHHPFDN